MTGRGRLTGGRAQVTGDILTGVNDLPSAWRDGRASDYSDAIEQHFYLCIFKLLLAKNIIFRFADSAFPLLMPGVHLGFSVDFAYRP